jgi:hypothetical protein
MDKVSNDLPGGAYFERNLFSRQEASETTDEG